MDADKIPVIRRDAGNARFESGRNPSVEEVSEILQQFEERAIESLLREVRGGIAEAERRGDHAELAVLTQQKLELDKALRALHGQHTRKR
jgi:DNA primase